MLTYLNCKKLIDADRYEYNDMMEKLDTFYLGDRITKEQYDELKTKMDNKK